MNHIAARLVDIDPDYADYYQKKLFAAKNNKASQATLDPTDGTKEVSLLYSIVN